MLERGRFMDEMLNQNPAIKKLFADVWEMMKNPRGFFAGLAKTGGFGKPVLTALFWTALSMLIQFGLTYLKPQQVRIGLGIQMVWLALGPVVTLGFGFMLTAVFFLIWHLMGSKENFETSFRCWVALTPLTVASALLSPVPFLPLLVFAYGFFLLVMASQAVHGISEVRSWAVWGILGGLLMTLMVSMILLGQALRKQGYQPGAGLPAMDTISGAATPGNAPAPDFEALVKQMQKQMEEKAKKEGTAAAPRK
jgi:hypothetical protein